MIKTFLRSALLAAGLTFGFAACSSSTNPDGGPDGGDAGTGTSTTGGSGSSTGSSTASTSSTSGSTTGTSTGTSTGSSTGTSTGSSTGSSTNGGNTGGAQVQMRLANFAPSMGTAVDICYVNNDNTAAGWQGPLFALGSGDSLGVPYPGVSSYSLPNGPMDITDVKVIPAPITNVANACIDGGTIGAVTFVAPPNGSGHLIIGAGKSATLAVEGNGLSGTFQAISVFAYIDETSNNGSTSDSSSVIRFINASPVAGTYDFGSDPSNLYVTGAGYGTFGSSGNADTAGYQPYAVDGGTTFQVVQLGETVQPIENAAMTAGFGYSFFFGTDANGINLWAFFCNDSLSGVSNSTFCYLPDGGPLLLTDGGF